MILSLLLILLLEGFVTISIEILTIRQLLPFFGGSVVITSMIIGIFLLFLALGYWWGGRSQQHVFKQLNKNFTLALIWIGLGLSYSTIAGYFYYATYYLQLSYLTTLFFYLILILAPIVFWLGQTIPLTTNLFHQTKRVSDISGQSLFISTMGSFLGSILTSLCLFQYIGVAWTLVINCGLLFFLILYLKPHSQISLLSILGLIFTLFFIKILNVDVEHALFVKTNNYANYQIIEANFRRVLKINEANSSLIDEDNHAYPYIEFLKDLLFNQLQLSHKQLLIIGAGGFTLSANGEHDNEWTYIDIDPDIKNIAESKFLHQAIHGKFVGEDARSYLNTHPQKFDAIISDAYSNQMSIPAYLLTKEYFLALKNHLKKQGVLIINMIENPLFPDRYAQSVANTIHAVFPYCSVMPINWKGRNTLSNLIYLCPNLNESPGIYHDNLNTATTDFFKSRETYLMRRHS